MTQSQAEHRATEAVGIGYLAVVSDEKVADAAVIGASEADSFDVRLRGAGAPSNGQDAARAIALGLKSAGTENDDDDL